MHTCVRTQLIAKKKRMYLITYKYAGMTVRGWECIIHNSGVEQLKLPNNITFINEDEHLQWKLRFVFDTAKVEDLYVQHMDESALFVLPMTLEQYAAAYPDRISKALLKSDRLRNITVSELACTPYEQLLVLPGLGAKTIADISAIMHNAHGIKLGLNLPYQGLTNLCVRYIPLLQNAYRSHYETYKQIRGKDAYAQPDGCACEVVDVASSD